MPTLQVAGSPGTPIYAGRPTPGGFDVPNELRVSSVSGTHTDYPLQFGRPFRLGEIADYPKAIIDGTPVDTQADVKTRHTDGSVKFAVISILVPSLGTTEKVITFTNQTTPPTTAETIANMLANYDFEATIGVAVDGTPVAGSPVSARAMLGDLTDAALAAESTPSGVDARYWTQGPICTTVLLHDHTGKAYDIGTNATKALRPMFIVQFWPGINRYHVRHILEIADCTKIKDEANLDITFTVDNASPVTKLSQANVTIYNGQVHSRAYWGGTDVPRCNAKHGVAFYADCQVMPNYDPDITLNTAALDSYASDWAARDKTLGATGYWNKDMAAGGGRPDIALQPKWETVAWYSGRASMAEVSEGNAELFCSFNMFFREGSASKNIIGSNNGQGRVLSKKARPTLWWRDFNGGSTVSGDQFTVDGTINFGAPAGWDNDEAHTPGPFYTQYLTTGGFFWYERLLQIGAHTQFWINPGEVYNNVGNGRSASDAVLNVLQTRAYGWQARNRGRAWWAAIDSSPERTFFDEIVTDGFAFFAGVWGVPDVLVGNAVRDGWSTNFATWYSSAGSTAVSNPRTNALHFPDNSRVPYSEGVIPGGSPADSAGGATAPWMNHFLILSFAHIGELGRPEAMSLAEWAAKLSIEIANSAEVCHLGDYAIPCQKNTGGWYQSLADIYDGWSHDAADGSAPSNMPANSALGFSGGGAPNTYTVTVQAYGAIGAAAIAMVPGAEGQSTAWTTVKPWSDNTVYFDHDPSYRILSR